MGVLPRQAVSLFADRWLIAAAVPAIAAAAAISAQCRQAKRGVSRIESTGLPAAFAPTLKSPLIAAQPHSMVTLNRLQLVCKITWSCPCCFNTHEHSGSVDTFK